MATAISASLLFERRGDVGILTLDRPRKRNALNDDTVLALGEFFRTPPEGITAIVLTASGKHFCAGLDLSELGERDAVGGLHHSRMWHKALGEMADGTVPVIASLRGAVVGGGLELAAAAHIRVAERSTFFALPEGQRGLFVGGGASVRVPRLIGVARMQDMMLTGRVLTAEEGERVGLASYLVDDGAADARALELAGRIAGNSPVTNYAVLHALPRIAEVGQNEGLMMESLMAAVAQSSSEAKEKMADFLDGSGPKVKMAEKSPVRPAAVEVLRPVSEDARTTSRVGAYLDWLECERGHRFDDWQAVQKWSTTEIENFWESIWDYFGVVTHQPYEKVLEARVMPGAQWFPGALINYTEHSLGTDIDLDTIAVHARSQTRADTTLTFGALRDEVRRVRAGLIELGVRRGDRVAGYLPNIPETLVAFLATVSIGAIWAACAPEFGSPSVIDRFGQIEPKVLFAVGGYTYGNKNIDRRDEVASIRAALPTVESVVAVPYGDIALDAEGVVPLSSLGAHESGAPGSLPIVEPVPFDHPLVVLFSSGTTGKPKPIVHGHGGILLETLKNHALHFDLGAGDTFSWFSTTAWMMWNALVGGLLVRSSIVMMDGNPAYPDARYQWNVAAETRATVMGMSPGVIMAARREGLEPTEEFDLTSVRQFGAAGSPLPVEGYRWICDRFGPDVLLNVGSGGTDVCTGIVQASPLTPVYAGEMSGASLGFAATAFDEDGNEVIGDLGELVITEPVPSMPVKFWGDDDGSRYRSAYFEKYPGVWCHGDWIRFGESGGVVITGRSDATLNRGGVRLGTAEFYRVVEEIAGVIDSLVVHLEDDQGGMGRLMLFLVTDDGVDVNDDLKKSISATLRKSLSPRHVPDDIRAIPVVPYNRTGKKLEIPVKRILLGADPATVVAPGSMAQADALDAFAGAL
ncbi:acetoacetate--CoA ligase [Rhodococcus sp. G-MC3]|uniref:acetoacetate--CoA ligase n=1 Tax=Rhodococcus sp. G-MC3 TaxID=3046209 RepID=UPI0024BA1C99|nr:acetoacetate--CoA ligase [Rhodococcus sp. G-MC3]MDJ0396487.1 acetoacetate--CoA ligase [Rhodococcus sp. G-MC3]